MVLAGMLLCELVTRVLKHAIQQARPAASCAALSLCNSHGMPSSHTSLVFFAAALHALLWARQLRRQRQLAGKGGGSGSVSSSRLQRAFQRWWGHAECAAVVAAAFAVAASRVYLGYHSLAQVLAGGGLGLALGAAFYALMELLHRAGCYAAWCSCSLGALLSFSDTYDAPMLSGMGLKPHLH